MNRCLTVTSKKQYPFDFQSHISDIFEISNQEIALKSIFYPAVYNITNQNNTFITKTRDEKNIVSYSIPPGSYFSNSKILRAMWKVMVTSLIERYNSEDPIKSIKHAPDFDYYEKDVFLNINYQDSDWYFTLDPSDNGGLLEYLGIKHGFWDNKIEIEYIDYSRHLISGFLYSNIVENNIIDNQNSRLIGIIPISNKSGYNHHNFINPIYHTISVCEISNVTFVLTDINGDVFETDPNALPSIIQLHIRTRN